MSDFIKSVVEEVMKPYQKPKMNPIMAIPPQVQKTEQPMKEMKSNQAIPGISRPNYQRAKMDKRLSVAAAVPPSHQRTHISKQVKPQQPTNGNNNRAKGYLKDPLAQLQTISLIQGKKPAGSYESFSSQQQRSLRESKLIGQTADGTKAWLFNDLHSSLENNFQRSLKSNSIGVITSEKCTAGQLFYLNDLLREYPSMKYCLTWDKESRQSFVLELYEDNEQALLDAVKVFYKKVSQRTYQSIHIYKAISPSPWLTKQLDIKGSVSGAAVIEGFDYYTGVLLADRYLKRNPAITAGFSFEKNYLLIYGEYDSVSKISEDLKKEAERIK
ncbi:hypothetical protein DFO73_11299 [Cytobacillus oceanisediminis]|uniref:Uncharacterized protein n=1 Tax=Cytobacillus oceanisediminis TaxID=665099 RepID=A0A2V2ZP65_9BACI|nr:hypothetical protein [Cytobacillus oceanisediminis]PWW25806.1 hypothetical protein DFO73_11299 [Cytobacillus oceanisediminis]